MTLLPGWAEALGGIAGDPGRAGPPPRIPRCPSYYAGRTTLVATADGAEAMADLARQVPLSRIGIDAEFSHEGPGVTVGPGRTRHDPSTVRPLLLSLALVEAGAPEGGRIHAFVVDLRRPAVLPAVESVLTLPCRFAGHFLRAELHCLLRLGLPVPDDLWDTWVAEKARGLGVAHRRYALAADADEADEALASEESERRERSRLTLVATCRRHGVDHPFADDKERLRSSFLDHPEHRPFTPEQVDYSASDAVAAALLYPPQALDAALHGLSGHLETVEMRWVTTNARMESIGFRVDDEKRAAVAAGCRRHLAALLPRLAAEGVANVRSSPQLRGYFGRKGLLPLFRRGKGYSFDRGRLDELKDRDPAIALIRAARRCLDLGSDRLIGGIFAGPDGRVHPELRHLGTHTGRQSSRDPNILGLGKVFRPLVVPGPGRGIGEVDLSQIEVGIAGAVYRDDHLVEMFNTGDVYSAMAQEFYRGELPGADRRVDSREFKARHPGLRGRMKIFTLSLIYGVTAHGLARQLGVGEDEGAEMLARFMAMFPTLRGGLGEAVASGCLRGHSSTVSGLRRYRASGAAIPSNWERNWMANHPVQGSACAAFKVAGNRLDRLYRRFDARLIIGLHDAYVYEAPLEALAEVGPLTRRVMIEAVQEYFPTLRPDAQINDEHPECWNKDGHVDSVERWIEDPTYTL